MGGHLNKDGEFQSDKAPGCPAGWFPMKFTDEKAQPLLWEYAKVMDDCGEGSCANDMRTALTAAGYKPPTDA